MYISFVALPLMNYVFLASLDEINGIFIPKNLNILYIFVSILTCISKINVTHESLKSRKIL